MTKEEAQKKLDELYHEYDDLRDAIKAENNMNSKKGLVSELLELSYEIKTFELAIENWDIIKDFLEENSNE